MYTAADFELDERHVIKNEKVDWTDSEFDKTYFLFPNAVGGVVFSNAVWRWVSELHCIFSDTLVSSDVFATERERDQLLDVVG